eukprot:SAG11_NODE_299_length_11075_cov_15.266764_3_plen_197_part_00
MVGERANQNNPDGWEPQLHDQVVYDGQHVQVVKISEQADDSDVQLLRIRFEDGHERNTVQSFLSPIKPVAEEEQAVARELLRAKTKEMMANAYGALLAQDVPAKRVTLKKLRKMVRGRGFLYKEYQRAVVEQLWVSEGYQAQHDQLNAVGPPPPASDAKSVHSDQGSMASFGFKTVSVSGTGTNTSSRWHSGQDIR